LRPRPSHVPRCTRGCPSHSMCFLPTSPRICLHNLCMIFNREIYCSTLTQCSLFVFPEGERERSGYPLCYVAINFIMIILCGWIFPTPHPPPPHNRPSYSNLLFAANDFVYPT
jgi:hypothetical protein